MNRKLVYLYCVTGSELESDIPINLNSGIDGNDIYLADGLLRSNFAKGDLNEWRDKLITAIPKNSINSLEMISQSENYKMARDSSGKYKLRFCPGETEMPRWLQPHLQFDAWWVRVEEARPRRESSRRIR